MSNLFKITDDIIEELKRLQKDSTQVVGWYAHSREVRGPFCRWFTISENEEEVRKGNVAYAGNDCEYAAAAMNYMPALIDELEKAKREIEELKVDRILLGVVDEIGT